MATRVNSNGPDRSFPNIPKGFSFENHRRNINLLNDSALNGTIPQTKKTGTTICGLVFKGGIVLGADTRATAGLVVDKDCEKIHYMAPNIYCCGAGTAADTEFTTSQIASQLELLRLDSGRPSRVIAARSLLEQHLFKYQGNISAALVLGGVDVTGPHLHMIYPGGYATELPFVTMGSGSVAAMSVMETQFKDDLTEEEAILVVQNAIRAGVFNDLGSGSNINYCIIKKGSVQQFKGTDRHKDLGKVARDTVDANDVGILQSKVNAPKYFANFPKGTAITVGKPVIENF
eukprot:maker-scaffold_15-snap-gene-10.74-mRNA-1 protein AED:0.01 eAED:0.01 QI:147/1/1/1/1/1/2/84/288